MIRKSSPLGMTADILSACARHVAGIAAGLFTVALVVRCLGPEGLGAWAVLGTTGFLLGLSDLGLSIAVQRAAARQDDGATRRLVRLTVLVVTAVCPCLSVCAYVLLLRLPWASSALQADIARAALPAFAGGLVGSLAAPLRSFLMMRGAFNPLAQARAAAAVAQIGLTAAGLRLSPSLFAPACGLLASAAVETMLLFRASRRIDPLLDLRPRWPGESAEVRDAFRQGAAALSINVAVAAAIRADIIILTGYLSLSEVGAYQVASRAVDQLFAFAKQVSGWLLHRLGDPEGRAEALRLGTAVLGGLVASGVVVLAFDSSALLVAWVGPLARERITVTAVSLLGTAAVIAAAEEVAAATLTVGGSTTWHVARPILIGHAVNVALSIAGVRYFRAWAVAGGTVCGNLIIALLVWSKARALVGWSTVGILQALAPMGAAGLVSLGAGWALAPFSASGVGASALVCGSVTVLGTATALLTWWCRGNGLQPTPPPASAEVPAPTREEPTCASSS